ncbi:MAG: lysophospholipase, partial [Cyanobacteria bacterium]|nr:lysophospholipase [Cyanobacteriota bacterium]
NNTNTPLFCLGESMGANLALWIASEKAELVDGLILSAICYKTDWHPRWRWVTDVMHALVFPKRQLELTPYIVSNLSPDENVTNSYFSDKKIRLTIKPSKLVKAALTNRIALKHVEKIPATMPILIINGERDMLFKSRSVAKLVKRISSKDMEVHILTNKGHLLLEHQQPLPVVQRLIDSWLAGHVTKALATDHSTSSVKVAKDNSKPN